MFLEQFDQVGLGIVPGSGHQVGYDVDFFPFQLVGQHQIECRPHAGQQIDMGAAWFDDLDLGFRSCWIER